MEIYAKRFLRGVVDNKVVMGMRGNIDLLIQKAFARDRETANKARQEITKGAIESARHIANLALHIAETYGFAISAIEQKNYNLLSDVLARTKELVKHLEEAVEEERRWREAFWKIRGGENE